MKWLKKINQLFTHKELLDNSEQPKNVEQEAVVKKPQEEAILPPPNLQQRFTMSDPLQDIVEKAQQQAETTGAFRFPLIPDNEEFTVPPPPIPERREERVQQQKQKAAEVDLLNIVLEPEPDSPGLRGVLQDRKLGIHRKKQKPPRAIAPIGKKKKEPVSALRAIKEDPSFEHRRFVPSVVPSPIFGYGERTAAVKKPAAKELSTMNELLSKHKQQEPVEPSVEETLQTSKRQKVLTNKSILQTVEYAYEELPHVREARLAKEQPETVEANDYVEPASPELMMHPDVLEQDIIRMPSLHNIAPKQKDEAKLEEAAESKDEAKLEEAAESKDEAKLEEVAESKDEAKLEEAVESKDEAKLEEAAESKDEAKLEEAVESKDEAKLEEAAESKDEAKLEETVESKDDVQPQQEPVIEQHTDEVQKQPEEAEAVQQQASATDVEHATTSFEGEIIEEERLDEPVLTNDASESTLSEQHEATNEAAVTKSVDDLFEAVCRFVYERQSASITAIKRQFHLNSSEAAPLIEKLEAHGYISEPKKGNRRDVLITEDELNRKFS